MARRERNGVRRLAREVRTLKTQADKWSSARGGANAGDLIPVDYFALRKLIEYFEETREAARRVIVARDALHQVFFSSADNID